MIQHTEIKTKTSTRIVIATIAIAMIVSTAALYFGMVVGYGSGSITSEEQSEYQQLYTEYQTEVSQAYNAVSAIYFEDFVKFRSEVRAFNAASVTEITTRDLKSGDGREVVEGDLDYAAYYIGFCSDESIFDSSLNDPTNPTALAAPLTLMDQDGDGAADLIEGWNRGVIGMRLGGVREVSIPGELAYGSTQEICGGYNSPLKFIIMAIAVPATPNPSDRLLELYEKQSGATP
jgi:peptidylprolyl isomerase